MNTIRILLIQPVTRMTSMPVETRRKMRRSTGYPGLGPFVVAALTPDDIEVKVVDQSVEKIDEDFAPDRAACLARLSAVVKNGDEKA